MPTVDARLPSLKDKLRAMVVKVPEVKPKVEKITKKLGKKNAK